MSSIRVLALVEATSLTGPARPILMHAAYVRDHDTAEFSVRKSVLSTFRGNAGAPPPENGFVLAAREMGVELDLCAERRAFDRDVLEQLRAAIEKRQPAIVETHGFKPAFMLWALRRKVRSLPRFAWVAFHHGYTKTSLRVLAYQELDRLTLRHADRLVTFNPDFAAALARRGVKRERITLLQNPVATFEAPKPEELAALRSAHGIGPDTLVVLSVGRLSREKAQENLIEAFAAAMRGQPAGSTRLLIVGDGPERPSLMRQAEATGAPITFVGHVDRVQAYYSLAHIFTLTSHSEGSPMALLEAMSAGLPAVATAVGGVPEITDEGAAAVLVKARDVPALTRELAALMKDAPKRARLGAAARERSRQFGIEGYAARMRGVYEEVLAPGRARKLKLG